MYPILDIRRSECETGNGYLDQTDGVTMGKH